MSGNTTSLYSTSSSNGTTGSNNFTTLYPSQQGVIVPTTPYGNANVVALLNAGTDGSNTVANISATGNVTANYFIGNGSQLTGIVSSTYGNAQVAAFLNNFGSNSISTTGNITAGNVFVPGVVSATGNIYTQGYFVGNFQGNISGNIVVPGANTQVLYNNAGNAGASSGFTFNSASNVATVAGTVVANNVNTNTVYHNTTGIAIQSNAWAQLQYSNSATAPVDQTNIGTGSWFYVDPDGGVFQSNTTGTLHTVTLGNDGSVSAQANVTGANMFTAGVVSATGNVRGGNINTGGLITATGNITGNYILGNGAFLTGITTSYGNANVANFLPTYGGTVLANLINFTNNSGIIEQGDQRITITGNAIGVNTGAYFNDTGEAAVFANSYVAIATNTTGNVNPTWTFDAVGNLSAPGAISAVGNVTANYFIGNGSQLTGLPATYANANVATFLANFGSNSISTTGNITASYLIGNGSLLTSITGANVTGTVANATYAVTAGSATTAGTVTANAQPNITSVGTLTSVAVTGNTTTGNMLTGGVVSATGNVTGNYLLGNGAFISGLPATYSNANVATFLANFGSNTISTTGNVNTGNIIVADNKTIYASGGTYGPPNGTFAPVRVGLYGPDASFAIGVESGYSWMQGSDGVKLYDNSGATLVANANGITGANILTGGVVSATGNVTGNYFIGNGSQLTGIVASSNAAGSNTQIQYNNGNAFAGNALMTFDQTVGNVTLSNLVIGTNSANDANLGGLSTRINTTSDFNGINGNATAFSAGQMIIGNGWYGNLNLLNIAGSGARAGKLTLWNSANVTEPATGGIRYGSLGIASQVTIANLTNANTVIRGIGSSLTIGGGSGANTFASTAQGISQSTAFQGVLNVGNVGGTAPTVGNVTLNGVTGTSGQIFVYAGSTANNAAGLLGYVSNAGNATNTFGVAAQLTGTGVTNPTNAIGFYMGNNVAAYGMSQSNSMRAATNYYFLYNSDAVAQTQLGSLRSYNEFRYDTATSGSITIDKNNAQVQYIAPTANVTISGYANMVTTLSDSVNTDQEIDTLTILVQQGATPYTVTLPTGSTYLYAGNISTVPAVANSQSIITVVASNAAGTVNYFTTVSTDQTTQVPAGGSNTQIQFNNSGVMAGNAAMTFDNTTGNVTLANIIIGSGNVGRSGGAQRVNTSNAWTGTGLNTTLLPGQIVIGNGYFGNLDPTNSQTAAIRGAKVGVWDSANISVDSGAAPVRLSGMVVNSQQVLTGNTTNNTNTQLRGGVGSMILGGSANNYTFGNANTFGQLVGFNQFLGIGQPNTTIALGNVTVNSLSAASFGQLIMYAGSNLISGVGSFAQINNSGNITNQIGMTAQFAGTATTTPTNVFGYYMPGTSFTYGINNSNSARAATNYYFLRNDDAVAQNQLGSLRAYHTFQAGGNTTGTWDIDKSVGQVQAISLTGNVTIGSYTNFVTTASNSVAALNQTDTVTLIIEQGATPYTVTMPTGNTAIRYASGVNTVSSTANTTTMIAITAYRTSANTTGYLTTISPAFS